MNFAGRSTLIAALVGLAVGATSSQTPRDKTVEAVRLNNLGVAYMNQRRSEAALKNFRQAYTVDRSLLTARLNEGIALLNLQQLEPARAVLVQAAEQQPKSARAWF